MSDSCRLSEALYVGLCDYIGTPTEVTIRREVMDMEEMIKKPAHNLHYGMRMMTSGSNREGFRFKSSDIDSMFWSTNHKVVTDLSQSSVNDLSKHSLILMEDTETPPGFVRLQLLTTPRDEYIAFSVVQFKDGVYLSSERWRKIALTIMMGIKSFNNAKNHGPCASGITSGIEIDYTNCLHCSYWSRLTCYWRKKCTLHKWPPNHVFEGILRNGCHFVPIGIKMAGDENEMEWRLSFSQEEQKLVYSMNHTQFLCYGLLKIFLKEVVNRCIEKPFLCSYFVKTTLFWQIQIGHITWSQNNLFDCFWKCFKYLLHCVNQSVMPNFFIPENNMFSSILSTVRGVCTRESLLEQLNGYYEMGVTCLLQSPTVRKMIEPVKWNSLVRIEPFLGHIKSAAETDVCIRKEIYGISLPENDIWRNYFILWYVHVVVLSNQSFTECKTAMLQKCTTDVLVETAFMYLNSLNIENNCTNKKVYRSDRLIGNLLKLAGRVGDVSYLLYLALYYYRTCRYREALHITALVKSRLAQPCIMYNRVNRLMYNESVAGWSLSKRMRRAWVHNVRIKSYVYYIQELELEQRTCKENGQQVLHISPYVLTDMLSVLCNYRLGNRSQCLQSLTDLQTLFLYDDGRYVPLHHRNLSWQILGICQHVVGDLQGALLSYQQSLKERPWHNIQNATKYRIAFILNRFNERN